MLQGMFKFNIGHTTEISALNNRSVIGKLMSVKKQQK